MSPRAPLGNSDRPHAAPALWILTIIAATIALSLGSRFFVPLTLGLFLAAVLHPVVALLCRLHVPQPLGAAIAVVAALAVLAVAVVIVDAPVRTMRAEIPKTLMTVRGRLASLGISLPGAAAAVPSPKADTSTAPRQGGAAQSPPSGIGQTVTRAFGVTAEAVFALVEILLLAFFTLAAGSAWRDKLRKSTEAHRGDRVLGALVEIRHMVLRYLLVNVLINAAQAALVAAVVWLIGYPTPLLWGVLTFIAEFIPYFGGVAMIGLLFLVGLADGQGFAHALVAPIAYLVITTLQNNLVSPKAYGSSLRLNPTAILAGVMFWGLVWGVAGVFLAVPLLAAMHIIAERNDSLAPMAVFLGE